MAQAASVDKPPRLPLVVEPSNRDDTTSKDAKLVNCYVESKGQGEGKEYWIYKRAGFFVNTTVAAALGSGVYNWRGDIYAIFGATFYKNGVNTGTVDSTGGVYQFTSCLGATPKLVLGNGVKAYTYDSGAGLVEITDVDFVKPYVKGWAYLDGTVYYMTADAAIRGSDINNPQSWDALNKLIAQIEPDGGVALAKQLVYVIAMKQWTTEIFYDAANATGSPLGRVEGAKINYGCVSADSVQDCDGSLLYLASNRSAAVQVLMIENLKAKIISTKAVERLLNGADYTQVFSWQFNDNGHRFYGVTMKNSNFTLVYDIAEDMWAQWTDPDGNYFPFVAATFNSTNQHIFQHVGNGKLYTADSGFLTDDTSLITVDIVTPNFDGGVRRKKYLKVMTVIADQTQGSTLTVRVSDDDYKTWTNWRTIDLNQKLPRLTDCGSFTRRATHFRHRAATPLRLQAVEMQLDIGTL